MDARFTLLSRSPSSRGSSQRSHRACYPVLPILFAGGATGGGRRPFAIVAGLVTTFRCSALLDVDHRPAGAASGLAAQPLDRAAFPRGGDADRPAVRSLLERPLAPFFSRYRGGDLGGGFLLGAALGLVFAPCAGRRGDDHRRRRPRGSRLDTMRHPRLRGRRGIPMLAIASLRRTPPAPARDASGLRIALGVVMAVAARRSRSTSTASCRRSSRATRACSRARWSATRSSARSWRAEAPWPGALSRALGRWRRDRYGAAPDFTGISDWLNSHPLTMKKLHGKVVLVDFWTYSCINCLRTLPHLEAWDARTGRRVS